MAKMIDDFIWVFAPTVRRLLDYSIIVLCGASVLSVVYGRMLDIFNTLASL